MVMVPGQAHESKKEYRGMATRYDKTDSSYAVNWNPVATVVAAR